MNNLFASLGVDLTTPSRMSIVLPGEIDPVTDENQVEGYIDFLPWDSDAGREVDRARQKLAIRKGFRQKSRAQMLAEAEDEDLIEQQVERLAALAVGWHLVGRDRKHIDVAFNKNNAHALFSSPSTAWLRRAAWVFVGDEANFMKSSAKPS